MTELIKKILTSQFLGYFMLMLRIITPFIALFVVWRCFTSFKKGLRHKSPVLLLEEIETGAVFPILYWENSIGRSKSCDICLPDTTVSRDHAVLLRREKGWFICDTDSKTGVKVNGKTCDTRQQVNIGDIIKIGSVKLTLKNTDKENQSFKKGFTGFLTKPARPLFLLFLTNIVHFSMCFQLGFGTGEFRSSPFVLFSALFTICYVFYFFTTKIFKRVTFEVENMAFLLSGIGIILLCAHSAKNSTTQIVAMLIGICIFMFMIPFVANADRATRWNLAFVILALGIFAANFIFGTEIYGAKNWIIIGPVSIQPSEIVKIVFVFVGSATLDKLQTKKNIGAFIAFASVCLGCLFLMRDFGTACVFFVGFLLMAFMRSGSFRTIFLILAVAVLGVIMIINFKPYVAQRFAGWGNIWSHINDSLGYQQTRTLTYIASGGLFGMGLGNGYLHYIAASESDLVFGLLCEEQGLLMGAVVILALICFVLMASSNAKRSRSAFYSIASCACVGIMVFQACLNIFGATDVFPLTGVTLPFISAGGTSMMTVWGLVAFLKASDERTYALKKSKGGNKS